MHGSIKKTCVAAVNVMPTLPDRKVIQNTAAPGSWIDWNLRPSDKKSSTDPLPSANTVPVPENDTNTSLFASDGTLGSMVITKPAATGLTKHKSVEPRTVH